MQNPMNDPLYGIFGGTFDPVHKGHLESVASVQEQCALERVLFVPSASPPHRQQPRATAQQRLKMVTLAIKCYAQFDVDDLELKRNSRSYTYDTVQALQLKYPSRRYCFIIGIDALLEFESWHKWRQLLASVHFLVMRRPKWQTPDPLPAWWQDAVTDNIEDLKSTLGGRIFEVDLKPNPVSATEIRYAIAQGFDVGAMIPSAVWNYICSHDLYTNNGVKISE